MGINRSSNQTRYVVQLGKYTKTHSLVHFKPVIFTAHKPHLEKAVKLHRLSQNWDCEERSVGQQGWRADGSCWVEPPGRCRAGGGLLGESHTLNSRTLPQASGSLKPPQFSSVFQRSQELGKGQGPCARADQSGDPAGNMFLSPPGKQ